MAEVTGQTVLEKLTAAASAAAAIRVAARQAAQEAAQQVPVAQTLPVPAPGAPGGPERP